MWTDNGAYYYYNPIAGKDYEDTFLDLDQFFTANNLPIRYMNVSSYEFSVVAQ